MSVDGARVAIYTGGLMAALALHVLVHAEARGAPALVAAGIVLAALAPGLVGAGGRLAALRRPAAAAAAVLVLLVPLGLAAPEAGLAATIASRPLLTELPAVFFAARLVACEDERRFDAFWRKPTAAVPPASLPSTLAAILTGAFLTLVFYKLAADLKGAGPDPATRFAIAAALGETAVHHAIVFLFFVILAHAFEMHRLARADARALGRLARLIDLDPHGFAADPARAAASLAGEAPGRVPGLVLASLDQAGRPQDRGGLLSALAYEGFRRAGDRFVRTLVPLLPLLGFVGTVVGIATAMADLPRGLGAGTERGFDIGQSLAGLAIKFETTLLGLVASLVAMLVLGALERGEAELAARTERLVDAGLAAAGPEPAR
ncbi:MotA/TolQ/ExbB proton channel family protein [Prosthecomicrobium sp. N25]|uniref:MotA/TolQ/ExbB proton channel family protein n=1 Tax=Prosthecomicrobium sp. N25 TaxID=3129254 RepID=UPI00307819BD